MFGRASFKEKDIPDLREKVVIVTGGNSGLGLETVRQLAKHNPAHVYLAARSEERARAAIKELHDTESGLAPIDFLELDLSSFDSIKAAVSEFKAKESRLDILVNNAGIMMTAEGLTKEGYEIQFGTNVMGRALLIQLLLPVLQETHAVNPETRVVNVSSASEGLGPETYKFSELRSTMSERHTTDRYCISKLADVQYTVALSRHIPNVKFIVIHPGMVRTNLLQYTTGFFLRLFIFVTASALAVPVQKGALTQVWAAVSPDADNGGRYAPIGKDWTSSKASQDHDTQEALYKYIQDELETCLSK